MELNTEIGESQKRSCPKCGHGNLIDARYCAYCGFFLGESQKSPSGEIRSSKEQSLERPVDYISVVEEEEPIHRCIRCGSDIEGQDKCQLCGLRVPEIEGTPDEFLTDFMTRFPTLITAPEKFVDTQPYHLGWSALVQPILWTTLSFIVFWVLVYFSRGNIPVTLFGSDISFGSFIIISMAILVLVFPWLLLIYIMLLQLGALIVQGRGRIERTCRAVCSMLFGMFLLLGTLLALKHFAIGLLERNSSILHDSPWEKHYLAIPFLIQMLTIFAQIFFLVVQIRILARVNYFDSLRSTAAHVLLVIPVVFLYVLKYYGYV